MIYIYTLAGDFSTVTSASFQLSVNLFMVILTETEVIIKACGVCVLHNQAGLPEPLNVL